MNSIWENTIGLQHKHRNLAVEERLNEGLLAHVRGGKRKHHQSTVCPLMKKNICFIARATDKEGLLNVAKQYCNSVLNISCGACKKCGETGHLAKDCRNF